MFHTQVSFSDKFPSSARTVNLYEHFSRPPQHTNTSESLLQTPSNISLPIQHLTYRSLRVSINTLELSLWLFLGRGPISFQETLQKGSTPRNRYKLLLLFMCCRLKPCFSFTNFFQLHPPDCTHTSTYIGRKINHYV